MEYELPDHLDTPEFRECLEDWIEFRASEKKVPLGPVALKRQLKKLSKHTETDAIKMVDQSINQNYMGIFPLKKDGGGWSPKQSKESSWCKS